MRPDCDVEQARIVTPREHAPADAGERVGGVGFPTIDGLGQATPEAHQRCISPIARIDRRDGIVINDARAYRNGKAPVHGAVSDLMRSTSDWLA